MKKRDQLKILLMQIRDDEAVIVEERASFARHSGLATEQISLLNVFNTPAFPVTIVDDYDALYIGGSSNVNVLKTDPLPFLKDATALIHHCHRDLQAGFRLLFRPSTGGDGVGWQRLFPTPKSMKWGRFPSA